MRNKEKTNTYRQTGLIFSQVQLYFVILEYFICSTIGGSGKGRTGNSQGVVAGS